MPMHSCLNQWSKIKHKKAANDAAKSNMYGALSREIIASVRSHPTHSTSPELNSRLAALLKKAKDLEITKEKIEMTLKKAENAGTSGSFASYEALGPQTKDGTPAALIMCVSRRLLGAVYFLSTELSLPCPLPLTSECQTDSPARTTAKVREAINKHGARLSSTSHLFQRTGVIRLNAKEGSTFDNVWETAEENGAEDVRQWESDEENSVGVEVS
jgi:translational activator of cytochrome c oxidase 1